MNGYPSKVVNKAVNEIRVKFDNENCAVENSVPDSIHDTPVTAPTNDNQVATPYICLPYKGILGENIVSKFRDVLARALSSHIKPRIIYKGKKLGSCFRIKDKVPL